MASLTTSRALLRAVPRSTSVATTARGISTSQVVQRAAAASSTFESPFKREDTTKIPDFSHYKSKSSSNNGLMFQYFMVGTMGAVTAAGAKATVQGTFFPGIAMRRIRMQNGCKDDPQVAAGC
jgi:ubiquinol-cytochrome c reductase iron-sulfur subunit